MGSGNLLQWSDNSTMKRCIVYDLHYGLGVVSLLWCHFYFVCWNCPPFPVVKSVCRIECCSTESQQTNLEPGKKRLFSSNFRSWYSITAQTTTADLIPNYPLVVFYNPLWGRLSFSAPKQARKKHLSHVFHFRPWHCISYRLCIYVGLLSKKKYFFSWRLVNG